MVNGKALNTHDLLKNYRSFVFSLSWKWESLQVTLVRAYLNRRASQSIGLGMDCHTGSDIDLRQLEGEG